MFHLSTGWGMSNDWDRRACRSRSRRGDQTAISLVQPHRLLGTTLSPDCHKTVTILATDCPLGCPQTVTIKTVLNLSWGCHKTVLKLTAVCQQSVSSLSAVCQQSVSMPPSHSAVAVVGACHPAPTRGWSCWNGHFMSQSLQLELNRFSYLVLTWEVLM